jgi:hypothetical protein
MPLLIFNETRTRAVAIGSLPPSICFFGLITCGCSAASDATVDHAPPTAPAAMSAMSSASGAQPGSSPGPAGVSPEDAAALSAAASMVTAQLRAACGGSFDGCSATPGCNEILACAARTACAGAACYCADARCETDGPCRAVIEAAPGARIPDVSNPSLGPAAEAASLVGACVQGVASGTPRLTGVPPVPAPSNSPDAGPARAGADAG